MSLPVHEPKLSFVDIVMYIALAIMLIIIILCLIVASVMALRMITGSLETGSKFCPECGHRSDNAIYCEYDGTELKEILKD